MEQSNFLYQPPFVKADLDDRLHFGDLLNQKGLLGLAIEVGTLYGIFAKALLASWRGQKLYCVDPYCDIPQALPVARATLAPYGLRCCMLQDYSLQAVKNFPDDSLDFVYIDANHTPPHPFNDLVAWWPKVRPGGLLAGHDIYCLPRLGGDYDVLPSWDVKGQVERFIQKVDAAGSQNLQVHIVEQVLPADRRTMFGRMEHNAAWSFYIEKQSLPTPLDRGS